MHPSHRQISAVVPARACASLHLFHSAVHLTQDNAWCRYGITHTLDQVFEAPPVVKHVMTDEANLNEAYVGTR